MNSQILYFERTTPQMEKIFNSYMDETVMLYNEEWTAQFITEAGIIPPVFLAVHLQQKWQGMVRDN